ncbi:MAG: type II toxin-antitoxin system HicB family antitoxin [Bryobacterales bacterium]|nr:type II toxin-antitoxin system HicB family antitoxin [Bryobacterales bacterium]
MKLTPVIEQTAEGYVAYLEEIPEARVQGATLEEAQEKLSAAVTTVIDAMRQVAGDDTGV